MKTTFVFLLILILAFAGYRRSFKSLKAPVLAQNFYLTGIEYLFFGFLIGPGFLNILDAESQKGLAPLCALVLGWVGLLSGFQFEIPKLRRAPNSHLGAAAVACGLTALLMMLGAWLVLPRVLDLPDAAYVLSGVAIAAAACNTAQVSLALSPLARAPRNRALVNLIQVMSSADGALALGVFSAAFLLRPDSAAHMHFGWLALKAVACIACQTLLFLLFLNRRRSQEELTVVLMGGVILGSGVASMLDLSPLVVNFATGLLLVNITREKERLYGMIAAVEKPAYLVLLIFLGSVWHMDSFLYFFGGLMYFAWRILAKIAGGVAAAHGIPSLRGAPSDLGLGLLDHGGMAMAILLDFSMSFPQSYAIPVVSTVLVGVVLNELLGPAFIHLILQGGGRES
ncbi:hypothetical protein [Desulfatibacillum aliphaticivorans]|uniref:hypothetical protein n=1 Tax=Desulfatibacillum aliphaticivorans TaxID=218208 RepID=UPI0003FDDB7A|nr:hypothetical protein [Desulfatibacillum aliphaticivorans]